MIDDLTIKQGERGALRLYSADMGREEVKFLSEPGAIANVLGAAGLDETRVQIIRIDDLGELGLIGFLREGCEISEEQLTEHAVRLEALEDAVLLVPSTAAPEAGITLTLDPRLRHVVTLRETGPDWSASAPIRTKSAKPYSAPNQSPRVRRARTAWVGGAIFFIVLFAVIALVSWVIA